MSTVATPPDKQPLKLNFKDDTLTTVSRDALRALAKKLGFTETQTVLFALARLRDDVLASEAPEALAPLTAAQHAAIAKAAPRGRGKVLDTLL